MRPCADVSFCSILLFSSAFFWAVNRKPEATGWIVIVSMHSPFFAGMSEARHHL